MKTRWIEQSSKLQAPSSREATSSKLQASILRGRRFLKLGIWSFSGAWSLELGAFTMVLLLLGLATPSFASNSFVKGYLGLQVVDSAVDTLGLTYVLVRDAKSHCQ